MHKGVLHSSTLLACIAAAVTAILIRPDPPVEPASDEPVVQKYDKELAKPYIDEGCWHCHSVSTLSVQLERDFGALASGVRPAGPDLAGIGQLYTEGWHVAHFKDPQLLAAGSLMPSQPQLFDDSGKLNSTGQTIIDFLQSLDEPSKIRTPWPTTASRAKVVVSASRGKVIFQSHCASCHGENADGKGPAAKWLTLTPPADLKAGNIYRRYNGDDLEIDDVYTTTTNGIRLRNMPSFNGVLSKQERSDVAAYVMKLYNQRQSK